MHHPLLTIAIIIGVTVVIAIVVTVIRHRQNK